MKQLRSDAENLVEIGKRASEYRQAAKLRAHAHYAYLMDRKGPSASVLSQALHKAEQEQEWALGALLRACEEASSSVALRNEEK